MISLFSKKIQKRLVRSLCFVIGVGSGYLSQLSYAAETQIYIAKELKSTGDLVELSTSSYETLNLNGPTSLYAVIEPNRFWNNHNSPRLHPSSVELKTFNDQNFLYFSFSKSDDQPWVSRLKDFENIEFIASGGLYELTPFFEFNLNRLLDGNYKRYRAVLLPNSQSEKSTTSEQIVFREVLGLVKQKTYSYILGRALGLPASQSWQITAGPTDNLAVLQRRFKKSDLSLQSISITHLPKAVNYAHFRLTDNKGNRYSLNWHKSILNKEQQPHGMGRTVKTTAFFEQFKRKHAISQLNLEEIIIQLNEPQETALSKNLIGKLIINRFDPTSRLDDTYRANATIKTTDDFSNHKLGQSKIFRISSRQISQLPGLNKLESFAIYQPIECSTDFQCEDVLKRATDSLPSLKLRINDGIFSSENQISEKTGIQTKWCHSAAGCSATRNLKYGELQVQLVAKISDIQQFKKIISEARSFEDLSVTGWLLLGPSLAHNAIESKPKEEPNQSPKTNENNEFWYLAIAATAITLAFVLYRRINMRPSGHYSKLSISPLLTCSARAANQIIEQTFSFILSKQAILFLTALPIGASLILGFWKLSTYPLLVSVSLIFSCLVMSASKFFRDSSELLKFYYGLLTIALMGVFFIQDSTTLHFFGLSIAIFFGFFSCFQAALRWACFDNFSRINLMLIACTVLALLFEISRLPTLFSVSISREILAFSSLILLTSVWLFRMTHKQSTRVFVKLKQENSSEFVQSYAILILFLTLLTIAVLTDQITHRVPKFVAEQLAVIAFFSVVWFSLTVVKNNSEEN